jgi:capsular exopolysaccharide synthesis family protein
VTRRPRPTATASSLLVVGRQWRLVAVVALLCLSVAVVWSLRRPPIYEATASVLVSPMPTPTGGAGGPAQLSMRDEQQVVRSFRVARIVAQRFGTSASPEQLLRQVSVEAPAGSRVLRISYVDPVGPTARTGADAFAAAYLVYRRQAVSQSIRSLDANLTREVADLTGKKQAQEAILAPDRQASAAERDAALTLREAYGSRIADLQQQLRAIRRLDPNPGSVLEPARLPSKSMSPLVRDGALGLVIGLLGGVVAALVDDRTDRRLRGRDDLAELLDRPVLTPVPPLSRGPRGRLGRRRESEPLAMLDHSTSPAAEAYRVLAARVSFLAGRLGFTSLMVTSPGPDEGKSITAANLALALAEAERDVLLISADFRRPRVHRLFALPNQFGLGDVLTDVRLEDLRTEEGTQTASELWSVAKHLWVLVSRPAPPEVAALLGSDTMCRLLERQRDCFDFVILDCPPALTVADALALAPLVDAVLVVADRRSTDRHAVVRVREQLEQVGGRILGAVLNRHPTDRASYQYGG